VGCRVARVPETIPRDDAAKSTSLSRSKGEWSLLSLTSLSRLSLSPLSLSPLSPLSLGGECVPETMPRDKAGPRTPPDYFAEMRSGSEEGSYLRLIDFCITQL